jgi:hypothetical protein
MRKMELRREDAQDRFLWKNGIFGEPSNPCKRGNTDVETMMMMIDGGGGVMCLI